MNLPRKDKKGNGYLSYSQISTFKRSKDDYYKQYIEGVPFEGNDYTDFGSKVGESLELNSFKSFDTMEAKILKSVKRLDLFERSTILNYNGFYVVGYIDTISDDYSQIIDYKTGGRGKDAQYVKDDYTQLQIYALSIRQETGITPQKASVEFITREGNAFKGESLRVAYEPVKSIDIDISYERLKTVYWGVLRTAKEISDFYEKYKLAYDVISKRTGRTENGTFIKD